jgi:MPBQ/MSBQ methyltransferase
VVVDGFRRQNGPLPHPIAHLYRSCAKAWRMDGLPVLELFTKSLENHGFTAVKTADISWNLAPSLLHIPWVSLKLLAIYFIKNEPDALRYAKALLLTLLLSPFKQYFGYYAVTCRKSSVRLGK